MPKNTHNSSTKTENEIGYRDITSLILSKDAKKLNTFLEKNKNNNNIHTICYRSIYNPNYPHNTNTILISIIKTFELPTIENTLKHIHKSAAAVGDKNTPIQTILCSDITYKPAIIKLLFKIYESQSALYGESMIKYLLAYGDPDLVHTIFKNHLTKYRNKMYSTTGGRNLHIMYKLAAILQRDELTRYRRFAHKNVPASTFIEYKNVIELIFLDPQTKVETEIPRLIFLLVNTYLHSYQFSLDTEYNPVHFEDNNLRMTPYLSLTDHGTFLCKKIIQLYKHKVTPHTLHTYIGTDLILPEITKLCTIRDLMKYDLSKLDFYIDLIEDTDNPTDYIKPMNITPNCPKQIPHTCHRILKLSIKYGLAKLFKFFILILKTFNLPLDESIIDIHINKQDQKKDALGQLTRLDLILYTLEVDYYHPHFYQKLTDIQIKQLTALQKTQLLNLRPLLDIYFTEKGLCKTISNYIGIDKFLIQQEVSTS